MTEQKKPLPIVTPEKVANWREWIDKNGPDMTAVMLAAYEHREQASDSIFNDLSKAPAIDHEHQDGCSCDIELAEADATPDYELPETQGGIIPA